MKRKILVIAPLLALFATSCFARTPLPGHRSSSVAPSSSKTTSPTSTPTTNPTTAPTTGPVTSDPTTGPTSDPTAPTSGTTTTTGTSGTSGTSSTSGSSSSTSDPGPVDTYGTLDNPITVEYARELGNAIPGATADNTVFETKDAYIKGIVKGSPTVGSSGDIKFDFADSYSSTSTVQFRYGSLADGVLEPIDGDEVIVFGRIANYHNGYTIELTGNTDPEIDKPVVRVSKHVDCSISVEPFEHGTISDIPTKAENGTEVVFTVTPDADYSVEYVKVNGGSLLETEGKYSFTVATDSVITVSIVAGPIVKSSIQLAYEGALAGSTDSFTFTGVVTNTSGNSFYVQDGAYGMYVYCTAAVTGLAVGKVATVTSTVTRYNGLVETNKITDASVISIGEDGSLPVPAEVTSAATLGALNMNVSASIQTAVLKEKGVEYKSKTNSFATFTVGGDDIKVKFDGYGYNADQAAVYNAAVVGEEFSLTNVMPVVYDTASTPTTSPNQVIFAYNSVITKKTEPVVPTAVAINLPSTSLLVGAEVDLTASVTPSEYVGELHWESSDPSVAKVEDGKLIGVSAGTTTLSVAVVGYESVNDTVDITVTNPSPTEKFITGIVASPTEVTMTVGDEDATVAITVSPEDYTEDVAWSIASGDGVINLVDTSATGAKIHIVSDGSAVVKVEGATSHVGTTINVTVNKASVTLAEVTAAALAGSTDSYTFSGVVTNTSGKSFYIQDNTGAFYVYSTATVTGLEVGKTVTVTSTLTSYKGLAETNKITDASAIVVGDSADVPAAAKVTSLATLEALSASQLMDIDSAKLTEKGVEYTSSKESFATFSVGGDSIKVKFDKYGYNAAQAAIYNGSTVGKTYKISGANATIYDTATTPTTSPNQVVFGGSATIEEVTIAPTGVTITSADELFKGEVLTLTATIEPSGATGTVSWSIKSGAEHATLDGSTLVGVSAGTVVVTATVAGTEISAEQTITVKPVELTAIAFDSSSYDFVPDSTNDMSAKLVLTPTNADVNISYSITGASAAGISIDSSTGVLTIPSELSADESFTVTATDSVSGLSATATVNVPATVVHVTGVSVSPTSKTMDIGDTQALTATVTPNDATVKDVTYTSNNTSVATVTSAGVVTAVAQGSATITVTTVDGGHTATCAITVNAPAVEQKQYVLDGTVTEGTAAPYNAYAEASVFNRTYDAKTVGWSVMGNTTVNPWRVGGKGITNVDREIKSTTPVTNKNITKVEVVTGVTGSSLTVNSISLLVGTTAGASDIETITKTSGLVSTTLTFNRSVGKDWTGRYFTIVFNVTRTGASGNGYIQFSGANFWSY